MNNTGSTVETERTREIVLESGSKYLVSYTDPHGYWYIRMEHGQVPECLKGAFTEFSYAKRAIESYLASFPATPKRTVKKDG